MDLLQHLEKKVETRRDCIARLLALPAALAMGAAPVGTWAQGAGPGKGARVLVVGDSLSAEYGLKRGTGWVALLGEQLQRSKSPLQVVNASISGDTTSGGRARLPALLKQHQPAVLVIELGGNDALRGLPMKMTEQNLQAMAQAGQQAGAKVLLVGMQVPPNYGTAYTRDFEAVFAKVAKASNAQLVPFLLKGVADAPDATAKFQADRIHPNESAQATMLGNVWPTLKGMLPG